MNCNLLLCELLSTTVWNTSILCHIYDFKKKFQVVVKLLIFILEISLTYLNTHLFLIVALHDMQKSAIIFFSYLVKCHELLLHHIAFLHMIVISCTDYFCIYCFLTVYIIHHM